LGSLPAPQRLNEPKPLYHGPSGTLGLSSIQTRQPIEVFYAAIKVVHSLDEMVADGGV
jgi:hypothetical protein